MDGVPKTVVKHLSSPFVSAVGADGQVAFYNVVSLAFSVKKKVDLCSKAHF